MDVRMPEMDGITATREVLQIAPETRVVIVTTFEEDDYVFGALAAARRLPAEADGPEELIAAIKTVAAGDALLSPSVTRRVIERMARDTPLAEPDEDRLAELTAREREVLELLAAGLTNAEIAERLVIEDSTVKTHVKRVLMKLDLRDRVQAVIFAYETGLIRPGSAGLAAAAPSSSRGKSASRRSTRAPLERDALGLEQPALVGALGQRAVGAHHAVPRQLVIGVGEHGPAKRGEPGETSP